MGVLSSARVSLMYYLSYFNMTWRDIHSTAIIHIGRPSPAPAPYSYWQDVINKMMGRAVVFTTVLMAILAGTLWVVGLERVIRGRFTLFSMVRFLLRITFLLFPPLLSYTFSHTEDNEGQLQFVLLWMFPIQLIRKKVEAMVSSTDGSFSRAASRFKLMDHYHEVYSLVWIGYLIYTNVKEYNKMIIFAILWSLAVAKLGQRVLNEWKAQDSLSAAGSAHLIAGYMQHVLDQEEKLGDPMDNCDYVVMGEENLILKKKERQQAEGSTAGSKVLTTRHCGNGVGRFPHDQDELKHVHLLIVDPAKVKSLVTVKQIWKELGGYRLFCKKRPKFISHMGLLCLSFSFFKLMRRRFEHYPMVEVGSKKARRLMLEGLLNHEPKPADNASRMFRVIQLELDFLDNYYQAGVPVVMSAPWLFIINFLSSFLFVFIYIIAAAMLLLTKSEHLNTPITFIIITMLLVMTLLAVEITDFLTTYLFSNWFLVHLICLYVTPRSCLWNCLVKPLIWCFIAYRLLVFYSLGLVLKLTGRPVNQKKIKIKQVSILQVCEPLHKLFAWTSQATLADKAKQDIVKSLKKGINLDVPDDDTGVVSLPPMRSNLNTRGETTTEIILAYHLATELLEMKHGKRKKKKKKQEPEDDCDVHRTVAVTLSRYCMYLVARAPEMLPDDEKWVSDRYEDVKTCLKEVSRRCCSTWCCPWRRGQWKALMEMEDDKLKEPTSRAGVKLFQRMQKDSAADAWNDLAKFWIELLIYLAPSNDVEGHAKALASSGGDLIACLWAFCTHAGIRRQPAPEKAELHANELHDHDSKV